jgi:transcriptional regulator with XRE-family HTH domain
MRRVKYERLKRGWTQQDCAVKARMHVTEISKVELGYMRPWPKQAKRLARVLGLRPEELLEEVLGEPENRRENVTAHAI